MIILGITSSSDRNAPTAPIIGTATNVGTGRAYNNGAATVTFTPTYSGGLPVTYTATSSPGGFTGTGSSSPVTVTGLQSGVSYTFTVTATNSLGTSSASAASNSITATTVPQAPTIGTATDGGTGTTVSVAFTPGATGGSAITTYTATSSPGSITGTGASSPITVSGLTTGTAYTFTVTATNANGTSTASAASNSVTPSVPGKFESIASAVGTGSNSAITFSNIPSTYRYLQIRVTGAFTTSDNSTFNILMRFNNISTTTYSRGFMGLYYTGSAWQDQATAQESNNALTCAALPGNLTANMVGCAIIDIFDYTNTSRQKSIKAIGGALISNTVTGGELRMHQGQWADTAAITRIDVLTGASNWTSNSVISLYGIKDA